MGSLSNLICHGQGCQTDVMDRGRKWKWDGWGKEHIGNEMELYLELFFFEFNFVKIREKWRRMEMELTGSFSERQRDRNGDQR